MNSILFCVMNCFPPILLNACQVFYYFFRMLPDELVSERLELEPASSLAKGVKIDEVEASGSDLFCKNHEPVINGV